MNQERRCGIQERSEGNSQDGDPKITAQRESQTTCPDWNRLKGSKKNFFRKMKRKECQICQNIFQGYIHLGGSLELKSSVQRKMSKQAK